MNEKPDFFDRPSTIKWILRFFYGLCILLVGLDFVVDRYTTIYLEEWPGFYAFYGFVACVVLVLMAKVMRWLLMRNEDYYDKTNNGDKQ